jgi:hypothetical protein
MRWKRFLWGVKIFSVVLLIGLTSLMISLLHRQIFLIPKLRKHPSITESDGEPVMKVPEEEFRFGGPLDFLHTG